MLHEHICLASVGGDAAFLMDQNFVGGIRVWATIQRFDDLPEFIAALFGNNFLKEIFPALSLCFLCGFRSLVARRKPILTLALLVSILGPLSPESISFPDRCPYRWAHSWLGFFRSFHSGDIFGGAADQCTVEERYSGLY